MIAARKETGALWQKGARGLAVLGIATLVSACAPLLDQDFWDQATSFADANHTALGLEQLASGNYLNAEQHFDEALRKNPQDGHALLWRSVVYQNTNRPDRAQAGYEAVVSLNPPGTVLMSSATSTEPRPLRDAAQFNLTRLQRGLPGTLSLNGTNPGTATGGFDTATTSRPATRTATSPVGSSMTSGDEAIAKRFSTLRDLQATGLVTPEEYSVRRSANLGALLPMSQPAPAAFLDAPPPDSTQLQQRLEQLNRSLQLGAITVQEHVNERTGILNALLPAQPRERATPPPAPQGLMDAARQISRLEDLAQMKLITADEFQKERSAVEAAIVEPARATMVPSSTDAVRPVRPVATENGAVPRRVVGGTEGGAVQAAPASSGGTSIHLASYRSAAEAERGWRVLTGRYGNDLGGLSHDVQRADIPGKGTYYRLLATGMSGENARSVCASLKRSGQYCDVKG
ncbi:MAG: tetratricopeptide repeat protein [Pseudomonadota bacterium]